MSVQVSYPGVYIEEFAPAAPIQGVGTSTAAFVGVNARGEPNKPTLVTSFSEFVAQFTDGSIPEDDDYLWYAVQGFYANGGKLCFVTAVSNAQPDQATLVDENGAPTIPVAARARGVQSPSITVTASARNLVPVDPTKTARLFEPKASISATSADRKSVTVTDAAEAAAFLAGDAVLLGTGAASRQAVVARVSNKLVFFREPLDSAFNANAPLRLDDLPAFCTSFRTENAQGLVPGSIVTFSQSGAAASQTTVVTAVAVERISATLTTLRITVQDGLNGFTLYKTGNKPITFVSEEFDLQVGGIAQPYTGLSMNPKHPRYYAVVVNGDAGGTVWLAPALPSPSPLPQNRPAGAVTLSGGTTHSVATIRATPLNFYQPALDALAPLDDVNLVVVPDTTDAGVQAAVKDHCATLANRFGILDAVKGSTISDVRVQRAGLENDKGFVALYYPWLEVTSRKTAQRIPVPPGGHTAGVFARTDLNRGVHKAPAGTEATVQGALGVERLLSDDHQRVLNPEGINVVRVFQHGGVPVVWGARTTSGSTNWQYVNIRRLFIYLEQSIQRGIRGSVFEPNNIALWQKLKRTIGAFLNQQWRDGALFGNKAEEAFYVRIDEVLNPDSERALGRLTIEIGVRPSYPAEFIVVRIGIWQGGSSVSES